MINKLSVFIRFYPSNIFFILLKEINNLIKMEFKCSSCDYTSAYRVSVERHITKKKKCGDNPTIIEVLTEIICEYCNNLYACKDSLIKHLKICKVKKEGIEEENRRLKKELKVAKEANKKLASININGNNNISNSNSNNITNNNILIQLRPYNDPKLPEDMDDICEDAWIKQKSVPTYIERVHFNMELPENHNMCITNLMVKNGKQKIKIRY